MKQITTGVNIVARATYKNEFSSVANGQFIFFYRIVIENHNPFEIQLMKRHWNIFDSNGLRTSVDGEGVVGEQPVLKPGESFSYESACHLTTGIGRMSGHYEMERIDNGAMFKVRIPEFKLEVPYMLN